MELTNFSFYYINTIDDEAVGALAYRSKGDSFLGSFIRDFDIHIVVVYEKEVNGPPVQQCLLRGERCQITNLNMEQFQQRLIRGNDELLLKCIQKGELIKDSGGKLAALKSDFSRCHGAIKDQMLFVSYARFLKKYLDAKQYVKESRIMDAYLHVLEGLYHWAELELIERGIQPGAELLDQVTGLNTPVRKLYDELTLSKETVGQRVELVLLACEFSVASKMGACTGLLLDVLKSRRKPWSIEDLMEHPALSLVREELPLVMRKLVYRNFVMEVAGGRDMFKLGCEPIRYYTDA